MDIFDIIGPTMIGPSSSHTAGAVRIGRVCHKIMGGDIACARIGLCGSFAQTYKGHGTDKALVAGLLGFRQDDERIRDSLTLAEAQGLAFSFYETQVRHAHPNTAILQLTSSEKVECTVQGASIGGGRIVISRLDGMETEFTGTNDTLIIAHNDTPGIIGKVSMLVALSGVNIGNFKLNRPNRGFPAVMVIEVDAALEKNTVRELRGLSDVISVVYLPGSKN